MKRLNITVRYFERALGLLLKVAACVAIVLYASGVGHEVWSRIAIGVCIGLWALVLLDLVFHATFGAAVREHEREIGPKAS